MKLAVMVGALMALVLAGCGEPKVVPQLALQDLEGNQVSLQDLRGKPVVVNVWATWCAPCRREMPLLQQAQNAHPDVVFVLVNQGEKLDAIERYLANEQLGLQNVWQDPQLLSQEALGYQGLPSTYFLDVEGQLTEQVVGELHEKDLNQQLSRLKP